MTSTVLQDRHVLHTTKQYRDALAALRTLLDAKPRKRTPGHAQLELLALLVEHYEARHIPEPHLPTPQGVVDFMLQQKGMTRADLSSHLGGKSRVSEFFAGKRPLSIAQIKALRRVLDVPADLLLG